MVLLDQFPRNAFRGTAHMYATDGLARMFAREAARLGHMARVEPGFRVFFVFPFHHSEDADDQVLTMDRRASIDPGPAERVSRHRDNLTRSRPTPPPKHQHAPGH